MNLGFTRLPFEIDTYVSVYVVPCQSNNEAKQKRKHQQQQWQQYNHNFETVSESIDNGTRVSFWLWWFFLPLSTERMLYPCLVLCLLQRLWHEVSGISESFMFFPSCSDDNYTRFVGHFRWKKCRRNPQNIVINGCFCVRFYFKWK